MNPNTMMLKYPSEKTKYALFLDIYKSDCLVLTKFTATALS